MASVGSDLIGRVKKVWSGLSPTLRWLTAGLLAALVLSLGLTWYLQRPQWEVFFKATDPSEVSELTERLTELKVQYRLTGDGMTITVPSSERSTANLAKAQAGLPSGGHVGLEIFAEPKFGATEFDKKVNYERAMEGELARALMRLGDIQYATVNLSLPEQSVFVRDRQQPSASVLVQPRLGRSLSRENVLAIVNFVASSVDSLAPEKVTVINDKGVMISKGLAEMGEIAGIDAEQLSQQRQREQLLTDKVLSVLEPIFGVGNVAATVNLEIDHLTTRTEERIIGQAVPRTTLTERSGTQSTGTTGTSDTTTPATVDPATGAAGGAPIYQAQTNESATDAYSTKTQTQFEVGEKNQVTVSPAGSVKRITTAVTVNREELTQAQVDQIRQLAANATGATIADVSVVPMSFTPMTGVAANPPADEQTLPLDPKTLAIALGIASFFLLLAFLLTRRRKPEPEFALPGMPSQPVAAGSTLDVALGLDQPIPLGQQAAAMAGTDSTAAELTDEAASAAQRLEAALKKKKPKRQMFDMEDLLDDDILADIDVMIEQAPEACAEVIRQWLKGGF